ncbi:MAG: hypothetical protein EXX96DRAFT_557884 [Benjaminiella poitrasii]|nr:MAG: hypothetical protein EXX96DRAFT_557884 [Benjaminiella poitrasii]
MPEQNVERKKTLKKNVMFRSQHTITSESVNGQNRKTKAIVKGLEISTPILQHSTTTHLFSSLISPTKHQFNSSTEDHRLVFETIFQPTSPAPLTPLKQKFNIAKARNDYIQKENYKSIKHSNNDNHADVITTTSLQTKLNSSKKDTVKKNDNKNRNTALPIKNNKSIVGSSTHRRHSYSSTSMINTNTNLQPSTNKNKNTTEPNHLFKSSSFCSKLKDHRRSIKIGSSYHTPSSEAASSIPIYETCNTLVVESSKSTPLRNRIKIYNAPQQKKKNARFPEDDLEKQRKIQELEDLITGRRGSTLKLTLTPKRLS